MVQCEVQCSTSVRRLQKKFASLICAGGVKIRENMQIWFGEMVAGKKNKMPIVLVCSLLPAGRPTFYFEFFFSQLFKGG